MAERNSYTYKLSPAEQSALMEILTRGNYRPTRVEYTQIAVKTEDCIVALYNSGKCLVQGKGAADFVSFVLEPLVLKRASMGYEDILNPETSQPHMGVDESGKGDFFGPLVVVSAYADEALTDRMRDMNVRDSKRITSDNRILDFGRDLRRLLGRRCAIVKIGPAAYNRLYAKIRNVNKLLSWAHARAIENLLDVVPNCPRAVSDQFGKKEQVERALMQKGRSIELIQKHRAESDLAVAAASIIAREQFVRSLIRMGREYDIKLAKGASEAVREAAVELAKQRGPDILVETAKCHFKTTDAVLKEIKLDRSALSPEGQVTSKPTTFRRGHAKEKEQEPEGKKKESADRKKGKERKGTAGKSKGKK